MILATEALAAAASAGVASIYALGHVRRLIRRGEGELRLRIAVTLFAAYSLFVTIDEVYWGVARWLGMPTYLLYGWAPLSLKIVSMYVLSGGVIWLYARSWRIAKAVGFPTAFWLLSCWLAGTL